MPGPVSIHGRSCYSRDGLAELLGVNVSSIDRRIREGTIRSFAFGARRLIPASEVVRLLACESETAAPERMAEQ